MYSDNSRNRGSETEINCMNLEFAKFIDKGIIYDLGQPFYAGIPHHPLHPPFSYILARKHGDVQYENGGSSANDLFVLGGHTGTHLDAIGHISKNGMLFGGKEAEKHQDYVGGLKILGIDTGQ